MIPYAHSLLFSVLMLPAIALAQASLEVTIENIKEVKGSLHVGLFNDPDNFPKNASEGKVVAVKDARMIVVFEGLQPGVYAISVFHDENDNNELDTNGIGIPKEGFGFGNDAIGLFGPPSFEKASVKLENITVKQKITLKHF